MKRACKITYTQKDDSKQVPFNKNEKLKTDEYNFYHLSEKLMLKLNHLDYYRLPWNLTDNIIAWLEPTAKCYLY